MCSQIWKTIYEHTYMYPPIRTLIYGRPYMDVHIWTPYKYIYERTYMGAHILTPIYGSDIYICRQKISKKFFVHIWFKLKGRIRPYMNHIRPYMDRDFLAWHVYGCPYMDMSVYGPIYGPLSLCDVVYIYILIYYTCAIILL